MGLFSKIKNVLFEEEEIEIPVFTKEEKPVQPKKSERKIVEEKPIVKKEPVIEQPTVDKVKKEVNLEDNERETFKSDPTFQFPIFDEKEYSEPKTRTTKVEDKLTRSNQLKNNIKKTAKKKVDFGRFDEQPKKEEEKKRFVPSPVISPVYGILDKNYSKADLKPQYTKPERLLDVDSIREKAYGTLEDDIQKTIEKPIDDFYEEPQKSINELLNDVIDEEIPLEEPIPESDAIDDVEVNEVEDKTSDSLELLDDIEKEVKKDNLEDTLENDLFNLIDSMYADREEEKE